MENRIDGDLYCHYSDLPSPMAYVEEKCMDYDSMGDYGRFPKTKEKKNNTMKRMIQKILLWWSFVKPKKMINLYEIMSKEKEYKRRLKYIHEDVLKLSKCLPEIDYDESMYDWESINRFISDIEIASNLKDKECLGWKTKFDVPTHDPQTGELNPYYEELTGKKNPLDSYRDKMIKKVEDYKSVKDLDKMPNQKWHQIVSFIKSGVRIIGYCFIPFNLVVATILLVFSEVIGIIEEMV